METDLSAKDHLQADKPPGQNLIYQLQTIVEPIDFDTIFPISQPVELELGSGDGSFLVNYACRHPERNFLGVERLLGRLRKIDRKGRRMGLQNLLAVRIENTYLMRYLVRPESLQAIHVYFPDPWPKRKHWHKRLINDNFPPLARRNLALGGTVFLRTDDPPYFSQMQQVFADKEDFVPVETPGELAEVVTDFERDFNARGIPTLWAAYERRS